MLLEAWKQLAEVSFFLKILRFFIFGMFLIVFGWFSMGNLFLWVGQNIENGHMSLEEYVAMLPQYVIAHRKVSHVKKKEELWDKKMDNSKLTLHIP